MAVNKLSELVPSQEGEIIKVRGVGPLRQRMIDMGLVRGARIKVIRRAPLGDPIEYQIKGYNLSLRKREANHILVEVTTCPLCNVQEGQEARIVLLRGGRRFKQRAKWLGLSLDQTVQIRSNRKNGPLKLCIDNRIVTMGQGMAQKILVEET